ncbi:TetR family transcriptional regulator [Subtercola sp. Z020]|uniref:TetR/AcrR family transcriptional regulator n=1 Tax=Subtercola sp. Z020 TaxID=2080582 RepID=UPI000CE7F4E0|nr:TetR/AcrR family transcriptional regulator [Subtercola sp. Z020]PPF77357.1 TetR family transcriptional regulator [Subtercola sp. Z020]
MGRMNLTTAGVLRAAADLADRGGYDAVTVSALARELGVQPASLYSHVRDRAAVLDGIHELALGELADRISTAIAGRSGRNALAGLIEAHRVFAAERPGRWTALQRPADEATARSESAQRVVSLIWAVFRGYELPEGELVHATRIVGATINGFLGLEAAGSFAHRPVETEQSWGRVLDVLDGALRAWPGGAAPDGAAAPGHPGADAALPAGTAAPGIHPTPTAQEATP